MSSEDKHYYQQRALVERSRAAKAVTPEIGVIHEQLAQMYEDFIKTLDPEDQTSNVVELLPPQATPQARSGTGSQ
jgi:hypothetical protein